MEARHSLSSLRGQGYAFFRPGARNSRHHTKDVGAAVEKHGGRRHSASHRISPSSTEGGIPIDQMGAVALSSAGCNPEMGRSTPEKLRGHDDRSRVTGHSEAVRTVRGFLGAECQAVDGPQVLFRTLVPRALQDKKVLKSSSRADQLSQAPERL